MGYRYSVIIPIFNSERTIKRCLDSLITYNNGNAEIIIVNDGSSDESDRIIRAYLDQYDEKIVYIQKENGGVSTARNAGLDVASGEYVLFVDSDDYVLPHYFEILDQIIDGQNVDFIAHGVSGQHTNMVQYSTPQEIAYFISNLEYAGNLASSPTKVFSRHLIEEQKLRFCEDLVIGEDIVFVFAYVLHISSAVAVKEKIYQIDLHNGESLSRKRRTYLCEQSLLMRQEMLNKLHNTELAPEVYEIYEKLFSWSFYHGAYSVCKELLKFDISFDERIKEIKKICKRFNERNITPKGLKCKLLAIPIRFSIALVIYMMIIVAAMRSPESKELQNEN